MKVIKAPEVARNLHLYKVTCITNNYPPRIVFAYAADKQEAIRIVHTVTPLALIGKHTDVEQIEKQVIIVDDTIGWICHE